MKLLLHKKCNTHAVNNKEKTGLDYAVERHHDHVVRVLETQDAPRGIVRVKTPPKIEKKELGRVAERSHWVHELLSRHIADPEVGHPCRHEGVIGEVLTANRNRGFVADNHYDISASVEALAVATSSPAFALPALLPSVVLWRALTHSVTNQNKQTHSGAPTAGSELSADSPEDATDKELAETIDQEWRKVLDRGLFQMSHLFVDNDAGQWEKWRKVRSQQHFLPETLGERLVFCHPTPPQLCIRLFSQNPNGKDIEMGSALIRPMHLPVSMYEPDGRTLKADELWDKQWKIYIHGGCGNSQTLTGTIICRIDWDPEPIKPIQRKQLRVTVLAAQHLAAGNFMEGTNDPYVELLVEGAQPARERTSTDVDGGTAPSWQKLGDPAGRGEAFSFEFDEQKSGLLPAVKLICWDEDDNSKDDNLGEGEVAPNTLITTLEKGCCHAKVKLWNKKRKAAGEVHIVLQYWDPETDDEPDYPELRRLRVTVFAAKGLPKKDAFGLNDPYAEVSVDGRRQRTTTISGGGSAPSWQSGRGESKLWSIGSDDFPGAPSTVEIVLFDEDQGSKDDMIGSATMDLSVESAANDSEQPWEWESLHQDEYLELFDQKNKPVGTGKYTSTHHHNLIFTGVSERLLVITVHVLVQTWDPSEIYSRQSAVFCQGNKVSAKRADGSFCDATVVDVHGPPDIMYKVTQDDTDPVEEMQVLAIDMEPRLPPMRLLRVTILHAQDLPKMDTFGATDPYIQIDVDGTIVRTATAVDGGANARWGDGKGEVFDFDCMIVPQRIDIRCFDEDLDADDEIGKGRMEIAAGSDPTEAWYREEKVALRSRGKKTTRGKKPKVLMAAQWYLPSCIFMSFLNFPVILVYFVTYAFLRAGFHCHPSPSVG